VLHSGALLTAHSVAAEAWRASAGESVFRVKAFRIRVAVMQPGRALIDAEVQLATRGSCQN
jgi:hypothetical protein